MDFKKDWFEVAKKVILQPKEFFAEMKTSGGYGDPLIFATINLFIAGIMVGLTASVDVIESAISGIFTGVVGIFIAAAILHLLLKLVGAKNNYEATYRVIAYLTAFSLLTWIPLIGIFIGIYALIVEIKIFSKIHEISPLRVLIAMLIPIIIVIAVSMLSYYWLVSVQTEIMNDMQIEMMNNMQSDMSVGNAIKTIVNFAE